MPSTGWLRGSQRCAQRASGASSGSPHEADQCSPVPGELTLVATLPELEYPREAGRTGVHVTGPMFFDLPSPAVELPSSAAPLVVVAPSTVKDPSRTADRRRSAKRSPASRCGCCVTTGGAPAAPPDPLPANAVVADWVDYSQVMREAALVICHGNHGTVAQALVGGRAAG